LHSHGTVTCYLDILVTEKGNNAPNSLRVPVSQGEKMGQPQKAGPHVKSRCALVAKNSAKYKSTLQTTSADMKSHTGAITTLGNEAIIYNSTKQKVNARKSTVSGMIAANNTISKILQLKV
jgi:hypothetical protein